MDASRNHGQARNETKYSRRPTSREKPFGVTVVTSATEVRLPRAADFILVLLNQSLCCAKAAGTEAVVPRQLDVGVQPELRLTTGMLNVYVWPPLLERKEVETIPANAEDGRTHNGR